MGDGKCTFGVRMPLNIDMVNATIYREVKHFRNYTTYTPDFGSNPVAGKFYAAHDSVLLDTVEQQQIVDRYQRNVTQSRSRGPHSKYPAPVSENQVYGWYYKPLVPVDRNDRRFYKGRRESEHTKVELLIRTLNPKSKKH